MARHVKGEAPRIIIFFFFYIDTTLADKEKKSKVSEKKKKRNKHKTNPVAAGMQFQFNCMSSNKNSNGVTKVIFTARD